MIVPSLSFTALVCVFLIVNLILDISLLVFRVRLVGYPAPPSRRFLLGAIKGEGYSPYLFNSGYLPPQPQPPPFLLLLIFFFIL
jgi:hypothetical protein